MEASQVVITDGRTIEFFQANGYKDVPRDLLTDINYLEQIASTTNTTIRSWPVIDMLSPLKRGDKRAINKLFFSQVDKKEVLGEIDSETFARLEKSLFDIANKSREEEIENLEQRIRSTQRMVSERYQRIHELLKAANEDSDKLRFLAQKGQPPLIDEVKKILAQPFYVFDRMAHDRLYMRTRADVCINYTDVKTGEAMAVNFGEFVFELDLKRARFKASPWKGNLLVKDCYHCFISPAGDICFGNAQDQVDAWLISREYSKIFEILTSLLTSYARDVIPFVNLWDFWNAQNKGVSRYRMELCQECGHTENLCTCWYCDSCDLTHRQGEACSGMCDGCDLHKTDCECCGDCEESPCTCEIAF